MVAKPADFSIDQLTCFQPLIGQSGEVATRGLGERILKAHLLGLGLDGEEIASIAALKVPDEGYRASVFAKSGNDEHPSYYLFELGWIYTLPKFRRRGHCQRLLDELLSEAAVPIFSTARIGDRRSNVILEGQGFWKAGRPFQDREEMIQLFVRS